MTTTATPTPTYRAVTDPATKNWHLGSVELGPRCYCGTVLMTPGDTRKFALKVDSSERMFEAREDLSVVTCGACKRNREYAYAMGTAERPATTPTPRPRRRRNADPVAEQMEREVPRVPGAGVDNEHDLARVLRASLHGATATMTPDEAADLAGAAAEANTEQAVEPSRRPRRRRAAADATTETPARPRRQSRASRANAQQDRDRARREALTAGADAALDAIDAATDEVTAPTTASLQAAVNAAAPAWNRAVARTTRMSKTAALIDSGLATSRADARAQLADMGE
jgi:hypothetical protein